MNNMENEKGYKNKFGDINLLTQEEKASYRKFAQKVHSMDHSDLMKLNNDTADVLTSEMKDIVAWEMKIREIETLKANGYDMEKEFSVDNTHENVPYTSEPGMRKYQVNERQRLEEMSLDLLEKSKQIIENTPIPMTKQELFRPFGGVNVLTKKFVIESDNGDQIIIDNEQVQEHFRRMYMEKMSEVTGIDYMKYDLTSKSKEDIQQSRIERMDSPEAIDARYNHSDIQINPNEYEDD